MTESINNLAIAQGAGDRFLESSAILNIVKPQKFSKKVSLLDRFLTKIAYGFSDCWYWIGCRHFLGYGILGLKKAHRVSWTLFRGPIPEDTMVLHQCDVRCCVNPDHLFLGNQFDNMRDMVSKGRHKFPALIGENNPSCKFSDKIVANLLKDFRTNKFKQIELSKKYKISPMQVSRIVRGIARSKNNE